MGREHRDKLLCVCRMAAHSGTPISFHDNLTWLGLKGFTKISLNWKILSLSYECTHLTKASLIINYLSALSHLGWVSCFENAAKIFFFLFFLLLLFSLLPLGLP